MDKNRESQALSDRLDSQIDPEILANLKNLEGLIYPDLFAGFKEKIEKIVGENPASREIILAEIDKTAITLENSSKILGKVVDLETYTANRIRPVVNLASENKLKDFGAAANNDQFGLAA